MTFAVAGAALAALAPVRQTSAAAPAGVDVFLGYADTLRPNPAHFPTPWLGSPNTTFQGCTTSGCTFDSSAVRVVNNTGASHTFSVVVHFGPNCTYDIWTHNTPIASGGDLIVAAFASGGQLDDGCNPSSGHVDGSDIGPTGGSWFQNCTNSGVVPTVDVTVDGGTASATTFTVTDSGQILNTGGIDLGGCPSGTNESTQWTLGGNNPCSTAALTLAPPDQTHIVGSTASVTATLTNNCQQPLSDVLVTFTVLSGPNAGTTGTATTNASGQATFSYVGNTPGVDTLQASVSNPGGNLNSNTVTVHWIAATPGSALSKAVRDDTTNPSGAFATSITANPGDTLEYRIVDTNSGNGAATNVVVTDPVPAHSTFKSCTPSTICSQSGGTVTWNVGTIPATTSATLGFTVTLAATLPTGCGTSITNVASFTDSQGESGNSAPPVTVTVCATPNLGLLKSAGGETLPVTAGQTITYTIAYFNTGNGDLSSATISDVLPQGTVFSSCSGGTACMNNGGIAMWTIAAIPGRTTAANPAGTVRVTVTVKNVAGCAICNTATISSPQQNNGAPVSSNQLCLTSSPTPNPAAANAHGSAFGAQVILLGSAPITLEPVSSSQTGPGTNNQNNQLLGITLPVGPAGSVTADVLRTTSNSTVLTAPAEADELSTAETLKVNVLNVVTADLVRGVASTSANGSTSSVSSIGSSFTNLVVAGVAIGDVTPNTRIDLGTSLGLGSYVVLYERIASTSQANGLDAADITVNMIHVHIGLLNTDVIVSSATAHSDFPITPVCAPGPQRSVSGHAFVASVQTVPSIAAAVVGYVDIPPVGGHGHQDLASVQVPAGTGTVLNLGVSTSDSSGSLTPTSSTSSSYADVANVCVLAQKAGGCVVAATVANSRSNSSATSAGASSNDTGTQFLSISVLGATISPNVPRNTVITLPGLGFVVLNEQFCDNGVDIATTPSCADTSGHHSGRTVRAIDVVVTVPLAPILTGAQVIVSEAHSDARFQ